MTGNVIVWIAFVSSVASAYLYYRAAGRKKFLPYARMAFAVAIAAVFTASALLMVFILQHRFEYNYVAGYSSRELPLSLLITTFWAGQEGSFMLWSLFTAIIGLLLRRSAVRRELESETMAVYSAILGFLLLLLTVKTPFEYIWDVPSNGVPAGFIPPDGRGLNPLLQNFWMIIHPPVLFTGFASLAVPFSISIAALWKKLYKEWIHVVLPWVLFSALALGSGLVLGGYWAYGVLGWGGWWGWDPVENSSLIPWIVSVILVHTLLVQMLTGRLARTNFLLSIAGYLLVVYSTFLTRSGILANASVHSFVDAGATTYALLVVWLAAALLGGFGMVFLRRKDLRNQLATSATLSRESLVSLAVLIMGICAVMILFGTSKPIFSAAGVEASFYDRTTFPLAILMTILLGVSLRAKWNQENRTAVLRRLILPAIVAVVATVGMYFLGLRDIGPAILALTSVFALVICVEQGIRIARDQPRFLGGTLAHVGLAVLFIGIIASGRYGEKQSVSLPLNQPKPLFGYELTYAGTAMTPEGKTKCIVHAVRNGRQTTLEPVMYESAYNNALMRNPDYSSGISGDFYIEPVSIEDSEPANQNVIVLTKGKPLIYGPMTITFVKFEMSDHSQSGMQSGSGSVTVGAVLHIKTDSGEQDVVPATTYSPQGQPTVKTEYMKNGHLGFQLVSMNVGSGTQESRVHINVVGMEGMSHGAMQTPETLVAEVSIKPFMSFVWIAAFFIVGGLILAAVRRSKTTPAA